MPPSALSLKPQQNRSRATADRLLLATIRVLDAHGLEGAVIPKIAEAAGVAAGSVYRRFADKDALLRAAFLHMLRLSNESNRTLLKTLLLRTTLQETAAQLITILFAQYRAHPRLLLALSRFVEDDSDQEFVIEIGRAVAANVKEIAKVMMAHKSEIQHSSPQRALKIAILSAISSVRAIALEPTSLWHTVFPSSEAELASELTRSFVAALRYRSAT
jgi:AcrR family transcriptional regulator